ncbi:hypothetical protein HDU92_001294 [Lobulomyces angularis]|nr:hypothetical protein HDU92_001294 [Lobulomyces angularis]
MNALLLDATVSWPCITRFTPVHCVDMAFFNNELENLETDDAFNLKYPKFSYFRPLGYFFSNLRNVIFRNRSEKEKELCTEEDKSKEKMTDDQIDTILDETFNLDDVYMTGIRKRNAFNKSIETDLQKKLLTLEKKSKSDILYEEQPNFEKPLKEVKRNRNAEESLVSSALNADTVIVSSDEFKMNNEEVAYSLCVSDTMMEVYSTNPIEFNGCSIREIDTAYTDFLKCTEPLVVPEKLDEFVNESKDIKNIQSYTSFLIPNEPEVLVDFENTEFLSEEDEPAKYGEYLKDIQPIVFHNTINIRHEENEHNELPVEEKSLNDKKKYTFSTIEEPTYLNYLKQVDCIVDNSDQASNDFSLSSNEFRSYSTDFDKNAAFQKVENALDYNGSLPIQNYADFLNFAQPAVLQSDNYKSETFGINQQKIHYYGEFLGNENFSDVTDKALNPNNKFMVNFSTNFLTEQDLVPMKIDNPHQFIEEKKNSVKVIYSMSNSSIMTEASSMIQLEHTDENDDSENATPVSKTREPNFEDVESISFREDTNVYNHHGEVSAFNQPYTPMVIKGIGTFKEIYEKCIFSVAVSSDFVQNLNEIICDYANFLEDKKPFVEEKLDFNKFETESIELVAKYEDFVSLNQPSVMEDEIEKVVNDKNDAKLPNYKTFLIMNDSLVINGIDEPLKNFSTEEIVNYSNYVNIHEPLTIKEDIYNEVNDNFLQKVEVYEEFLSYQDPTIINGDGLNIEQISEVKADAYGDYLLSSGAVPLAIHQVEFISDAKLVISQDKSNPESLKIQKNRKFESVESEYSNFLKENCVTDNKNNLVDVDYKKNEILTTFEESLVHFHPEVIIGNNSNANFDEFNEDVSNYGNYLKFDQPNVIVGESNLIESVNDESFSYYPNFLSNLDNVMINSSSSTNFPIQVDQPTTPYSLEDSNSHIIKVDSCIANDFFETPPLKFNYFIEPTRIKEEIIEKFELEVPKDYTNFLLELKY